MFPKIRKLRLAPKSLRQCPRRGGNVRVGICKMPLHNRLISYFKTNLACRPTLHQACLSGLAIWYIISVVHVRDANAQFNIELVRLADSNHPNAATWDEELQSHPDNAIMFSDVDGAQLQATMEHVAQVWEGIFAPNDHTIEITWFWDWDLPQIDPLGNQPNISAQAGSETVDVDGDGRVDFAAIRFNPNRTDWWFAPTPADNSEFNVQQQLFGTIQSPKSCC